MADWYNLPHDSVKGWNKSAPWGPVYNSIDGAKYTPSLAAVAAATDATATKQLLVNLIKLTVQQNMLLALQNVDARDSGNVDALLDTVTAVYTLSGNNTVSPGGRPTEVTTAAPVIENHVQVEPTPLTVNNNVQPAEVVVSLPARRTETEVQERDDDGNIRKVVHTETTIQ